MCDAGGGTQSAQYSDSYSHCYLLSVLRRRTLDPGHLSCQQTTAALCTLAQPSSPTVLEHSVLQLLQLSTYDDPASPQTAAVVHFRKPLRAQVTVSGPHPTSRHKFRGCSSFQSSSSEQSPAAAVLSSHSASAQQSFSTN